MGKREPGLFPPVLGNHSLGRAILHWEAEPGLQELPQIPKLVRTNAIMRLAQAAIQRVLCTYTFVSWLGGGTGKITLLKK